jgi:DNA-binding NarL/FixJ family response regulator
MPGPPTGNGKQPLNSPSRDEMRERLRTVSRKGTRKAEILDCLLRCITSDYDIGQALKMSPNTVKQHFTEIYAAVGVSDRLTIGLLWRDIREGTGSGEGRSGETRNGDGESGCQQIDW